MRILKKTPGIILLLILCIAMSTYNVHAEEKYSGFGDNKYYGKENSSEEDRFSNEDIGDEETGEEDTSKEIAEESSESDPGEISDVTIDEMELSYSYFEGFYEYKLNEASTYATIIAYSGNELEVTIPETLGGCSVYIIGDSAFKNNNTIKKLTIPENVGWIYTNAFENCTELRTLVISGNPNISSKAFANCALLSSVTIDGDASFGDKVFEKCTALTEVTVNGNICGNMGSNTETFYNAGAKNGFTVKFKDGVTKIPAIFQTRATKESGEYARIKEVFISDTVAIIEDSAFCNCYDLCDVHWGSGIVEIGKDAFSSTAITAIVLPATIKELGHNTFENCTALTSVTINGDVKSCYPDAYNVFYNAGVPEGFTVTFGEGVTEIPYGIFGFFSAPITCVRVKEVVIPDTVVTIGSDAFSYCYLLKDVKWGKGIETIGKSAFEATLITDVILTDKIDYIDDYAFRGCTSINSITINGRPAVWNGAFKDCTALESVTINGQSRYGAEVFANCTALKTVTVNSNLSPYGFYDNMFSNAGSEKGFSVSFRDGVTEINEKMFGTDAAKDSGEYARIAEVNIPKSVTSIGNSAFHNCYDLSVVKYKGTKEDFKKITIGENNESLTNARLIVSESVVEIFDDVKENQWYVPAVQYVYDNGIMVGTGNTFGINSPLKREQFAATLYSMAGKPEIAPDAVCTFSDVPKRAGYPRDGIIWAVQNKVAAGNANGTFGVGQSIQRQAVVSMLYKYAQLCGYDLSYNNNSIAGYSDASKVQSWAATAMKWAVYQGFISGKGGNRLDPTGTATRAECAMMIMRLQEKNKK